MGTSLHFRSPSIVFGQPITRVFKFLPLNHKKRYYFTKHIIGTTKTVKHHMEREIWLNQQSINIVLRSHTSKFPLHYLLTHLKFSARRQAFVLESSPPITTSPSKSSFFAVSSACLNWKIRPIQLSSYLLTYPSHYSIMCRPWETKESLTCSGVSILSLPLHIISNPP